MRIDLHLHSKYSRDGCKPPAELALAAKRRGLDGIALTDHGTTAGWREALAAGRKYGIEVIRGEEVRVRWLGKEAEVIALFLTAPVESSDALAAFDEIRGQGGISSLAHPFDGLRPHYEKPERLIGRFDAVEAFNSWCISDRPNREAAAFARKNRLPVTAGSDDHSGFCVGNGYLEADAGSLEGFRRALLRRSAKAHGVRSGLFAHSVSALHWLVKG